MWCVYYTCILWGRDSSVGIATRYGLDGPGIGSRFWRDVAHPSRPALGPTQPPVSLLGGNWLGRGADHPPPSSAEVEGRVELYLYSPSGPSWPVIGRPLPLPSVCVLFTSVAADLITQLTGHELDTPVIVKILRGASHFLLICGVRLAF